MTDGDKFISVWEERKGAISPITRTCIELIRYLGNDIWIVKMCFRNPKNMKLSSYFQVQLDGGRIYNNFVKVSNFSESPNGKI